MNSNKEVYRLMYSALLTRLHEMTIINEQGEILFDNLHEIEEIKDQINELYYLIKWSD